MKNRDAVRQALRFVEVVGRDEHRASGLAPIFEHAPHASGELGIETRRRFVEEQNAWCVEQRPRQRHFLAPAFRQLGGSCGRIGREAERIDRGIHGVTGPGEPVQIRRRSRRFSRTVRRSQSPGDSVRKPMRLRSALPVAASQDDAVYRDRSARRCDQPCQHPHRRRLAGAVGTEQRHDLSPARPRN